MIIQVVKYHGRKDKQYLGINEGVNKLEIKIYEHVLLRSLFRAKDVNVRFCITQVLSRDSFFEATKVSTTTLTTKSFVYRWLLHTCIFQCYKTYCLTGFNAHKMSLNAKHS